MRSTSWPRAKRGCDDWAAFAEEHHSVVVAPLFAAGIDGPDDLDGYKMIRTPTARYDHVLFSILEEVTARWGVDTSRVFLAGHSGGGQFTLRMLLLRPARWRGIAISAPGRLTLVERACPWPRGVSDTADRFGIVVDPAAVARVPTLLLVGAADDGSDDLAAQNDPSQAGFGRTRRERFETLRRHLETLDLPLRARILPGQTHAGRDWVGETHRFFADLLAAGR